MEEQDNRCEQYQADVQHPAPRLVGDDAKSLHPCTRDGLNLALQLLEDQLAHLFKPFNSSKGMSGTGIGLAAAKKIIDELSGQIDVTSTVGKGTRFAIRLPAGEGDAADAEKTHGPPTK